LFAISAVNKSKIKTKTLSGNRALTQQIKIVKNRNEELSRNKVETNEELKWQQDIE